MSLNSLLKIEVKMKMKIQYVVKANFVKYLNNKKIAQFHIDVFNVIYIEDIDDIDDGIE
jgi:hypothetical protein